MSVTTVKLNVLGTFDKSELLKKNKTVKLDGGLTLKRLGERSVRILHIRCFARTQYFKEPYKKCF